MWENCALLARPHISMLKTMIGRFPIGFVLMMKERTRESALFTGRGRDAIRGCAELKNVAKQRNKI